MNEADDDSSSSGSPLPVRRKARNGIEVEDLPEPRKFRKKAKNVRNREREKVNRKKKDVKTESKSHKKRPSRQVYRPPSARVANPEKVKWERRNEKERIAEFTRDYGDESDEDRQTIRRERINVLKDKIARLEVGNNRRSQPKSDRRSRRTNGRERRRPTSSKRQSKDRGHSHSSQSPLPPNSGTKKMNRFSRRKTTRDAENVESFEHGARLLLQKTVRTQAKQKKDEKLVEVKLPLDSKEKGLKTVGKGLDEKKLVGQFTNDITVHRNQPVSGSKPMKGGLLFSLLDDYRKGKAASQTISLEEAALAAIPVKGNSKGKTKADDVRPYRNLTDHQKLYDVVKHMESRLRSLGTQEWKTGWAAHARETMKLRSDLRDVCVDIVMRAPAYALAKNVVLRSWMTFYKEIQHLKLELRKRATSEGRSSLNSAIERGVRFFRGFVECVCVRFNLYPKSIDEKSSLEHEKLKNFLLRQYGEVKVEGGRFLKSISRIVAELYLAIGDLERYRAILVSKKDKTEKSKVMERARTLYVQAVKTCPGYGKAHNQLAMVAAGDELEVVFQYCMALHGLESFPARENLLAAFELSRKRFEGQRRGPLSRTNCLKIFASIFVRLSGILFTKIGMESSAKLSEDCIEAFRFVLQNGQLSDGILMRITVVLIVLAQKGRMEQNTRFYNAKRQLKEKKEVTTNGATSKRIPPNLKSISEMTFHVMQLIFLIFGSTSRVTASNRKLWPFLSPLAVLCLWIHKNDFVVKSGVHSDQRTFFLEGLARVANALLTNSKSISYSSVGTLELVSGFEPLGQLSEFASRPQAPLRPLNVTLKHVPTKNYEEKSSRNEHFSTVWLHKALRKGANSVLCWNGETKRFSVKHFEANGQAEHGNGESIESANTKTSIEVMNSLKRKVEDKKSEESGVSVLEVKGKAGVMDGVNDLVAIARARAARAREEAREAKLIEHVIIDGKAEVKKTSGIAAAVAKIAKEKPLLILDLPNICMRHGDHKKFSCAGIQLCIDHFRAKGFKRLIAFIPAHLLDYDHVGKHRALVRLGMETQQGAKTKLPDNVSLLLSLKDEGYVVSTPPQDYDDSYCIAYAHKNGGYVVTNDKYRDCTVEGVTRDWLRSHLMTFTFVKDEFVPNPDFKFT
mmetsp:Transcript_7963/g.12026  ORF Transcript_7963/g.12026 Transcript_7963/m.12026 type:complete len:1134 (+) Transcript_7963:30-3431(+)